jgi:dephospho-CoA kinase
MQGRDKVPTKVVGLTGSIGTGKSTTVRMLRRLKLPVQEADAFVHVLFQNAAIIAAIGNAFPTVVVDGIIHRPTLRQLVFKQRAALKKLEAILHPQVRARHLQFIAHHQEAGTPLIVLDIPLLFEVGWQRTCDIVVVTDCNPLIQRQRVLARPGMTADIFDHIVAQQWPPDKKKANAQYVLETGISYHHTFQQIKKILRDCKR